MSGIGSNHVQVARVVAATVAVAVCGAAVAAQRLGAGELVSRVPALAGWGHREGMTAEVPEEDLRKATTRAQIERCVIKMGFPIEPEMTAIRALFLHCVPASEPISDARKREVWRATFGELGDEHTVVEVYERFGCLPSQISAERRRFMTTKFCTACENVAKAKRDGLKVLNLSGLDLLILPREIGECTALRELNVAGNQITRLPLELGQLAALVRLRVFSNPLTMLPPKLARISGWWPG